MTRIAVADDEPEFDFWVKILPPEPEPQPVDPATVPMEAWSQFRAEAGICNSNDFVGIEGWTRPQRHIEAEPTFAERYAQERQAAGIHDAPQASAGNPRSNPSAYRIC